MIGTKTEPGRGRRDVVVVYPDSVGVVGVGGLGEFDVLYQKLENALTSDEPNVRRLDILRPANLLVLMNKDWAGSTVGHIAELARIRLEKNFDAPVIVNPVAFWESKDLGALFASLIPFEGFLSLPPIESLFPMGAEADVLVDEVRPAPVRSVSSAYEARTEVDAFVAKRSFLGELLRDVAVVVPRYFGESSKLCLELMDEPEAEGYQQLVVYIQAELTVDEAIEKLEHFDRGWWLGQMERARGLLIIDVDFSNCLVGKTI